MSKKNQNPQKEDSKQNELFRTEFSETMEFSPQKNKKDKKNNKDNKDTEER